MPTTPARSLRPRTLARLAACLVLSTTASLSAVTLAPLAYADDVADEADLQFRLAAERYQASDFRGALEHFLASNRLAPNRNVLFNIARCYEALREYPDAYRYYVRASQGETDAAAKARIDEAMRRMAPNVAILKVVTDPPGATLYLDRKDLGQRGAGPQTLGLAPGTYKVIAEAPGYEDAVSPPTSVQAGGSAAVELKLTRILGTVHVAGEEAQGATIRVDSEESPPLCTAPCDLQLPPGRHTLYITREGYKSFVTLVDVLAKQTITTRPSIEAKTGSVVVSTDEPGASVEIDGFARSTTPALLTLPVGHHEVRVIMRGFRTIARSINVEANAETRLDNLPLVPLEEVEAASRVAESVEDAPASVTIISQQELRGMAYPTVYQALQGVRGVYTSFDGAYDSAGFRGFGPPGTYGDTTLVLLNGEPMNDNWVWSSYIGYDLRTDLEDVQRIEIVRGPGSVLYGTGAMSGVINIVTKPHDSAQGYEVGASATDGSVARGRASATYDFGGGAGMWTSVQASHSSGTSYTFPQFADDSLTHGTTPANVDRLNAGTWTGQLWWKALSVQWSLNSHDKHLPTGQFSTILGDDRTQQTDTRGMIEAKFEPKIGDKVQSITRAHLNYYQYDGNFAYPLESGGVTHNGFKGSWFGIEERLVLTPIKEVRVTVGGEVQEHFLANQEGDTEVNPSGVATGTPAVFLDDHRTFQIGAGYAVADVTPTRAVKFSLGGRFDDYSTFGNSFNPRVAAILKPYEGGNVKVMFGKAFLAPSIYQLYWAQPQSSQADPQLHAQSMYSGEIEYSHRFSPTVVGLVTAYENVVTDEIALVPAPQCGPSCTQFVNTTGPVGTAGGEAELRKEWKDGWMASASYSYAHSVYLQDGSFSSIASLARDPTRREVPNAPEHLASVKGAVPILGRALMATTRLSFASGRYDINDQKPTLGAPQAPQTETTPAFLWDLVLSGQEPRYHVRYSLGMYNAFDWKYSVPVSSEFTQPSGATLGVMPQMGRTVMAAAYVTF
jgi:outer membrane receptor protein involved in Fe transport